MDYLDLIDKNNIVFRRFENEQFEFISNNRNDSSNNGTRRNNTRIKRAIRKRINIIITTKKPKYNWIYKKHIINYRSNENRGKTNIRAKKSIRK